MKRSLPLLLLALVVAAFVLGRTLRDRFGVELEPESVHVWVAGFGWKAPAIFIALVVFRGFLLLPSIVVLLAGGLCFGAPLGTILGTAGIWLSGLMYFVLARGIGREWIRRRFGKRLARFEHRVERAGPLIVALVTAYPGGPMSPFHAAAGLSSIRLGPFVVAVAVGGVIRAFAYSYFGSTLLDLGSMRFYAAAAIIAAVTILPFIHTGLRRRLFEETDERGRPEGPP
jgi:uncharacterized membrane protein YdjX (TVP38/TMEM64 family)